MSWEPRPITEAEIPAYLTQIRRAFWGTTPSVDEIDAIARILELGRTLAVFDQGQMVATNGIISYDLTLPGGAAVPAAGVSRVTVRATHRRRGLLTALMRRQLDDVRALGEPVAILWPSEAPIYGRFGYGLATYGTRIEVRRPRSAFRRPLRPEGLREIDAGEAADIFPRLIELAAPSHPGFIRRRSSDEWGLRLRDHPDYRLGRSEQFLILHEGADGPDGYTLYRKQIDRMNGSTLHVEDLVALNGEAYAALWRHCLDVDLMAGVVASNRSVDEPLRHLLADPRAAETMIGDALWLRLVDVGPALALRRYDQEGCLRIEVRDEFCPWNTGVYQLEAGPDGARCERTSAEPDLALAADALGACYLAGNRFRVLAGAGIVEERTPGALARADAMFGWPVAPWCPFHF